MYESLLQEPPVHNCCIEAVRTDNMGIPSVTGDGLLAQAIDVQQPNQQPATDPYTVE